MALFDLLSLFGQRELEISFLSSEPCFLMELRDRLFVSSLKVQAQKKL